ncbi:MAG TPA: EAL domain-containing protein [Gallionellaceae bacterium]|nr:EAL domain-containing protein [Gallionellaceae bacterium]
MHNDLDLVVYPAGATVFRRGDAGDRAYLVQRGSVEVLGEFDGREVRLTVLGGGELFGEVALLDEGPRTATVRTLEETVLIPVPRREVRELLDKSDPVMRLFLLVVLERFRDQQHYAGPPREPQSAANPTNARKNMMGEATQKLALAHGISGALAHDEFQLHYQPICNLATGDVVGFEALIRWQHPRDGLILPEHFLWVAEQTGLIRDVGIWTLEQACRDWPRLRTLATAAKPFISVNLSPAQLISETLAEDILKIMVRYEIHPSELKLELTETVMIEQPDLASRILSRLVELGSGLALDDYGTGYSGLQHLQTYPIGTLKIDRAFIASLRESPQSREIVQSSIALAHSLGMQVIAEGVEDERVRELLIEMACDFAQGWFYGHPKPLHEHMPAMRSAHGQAG